MARTREEFIAELEAGLNAKVEQANRKPTAEGLREHLQQLCDYAYKNGHVPRRHIVECEIDEDGRLSVDVIEIMPPRLTLEFEYRNE